MHEGPVLQKLMQRLSEIPADFFLPPMRTMYGGGKEVEINIPGIISDLIFEAGGGIPVPHSLAAFMYKPNEKNTNYLRVVTLCCYLFHMDWFIESQSFAQGMLKFLKSSRLLELAKIVNYKDFIQDMERREELVRMCLDSLKLYPHGENEILAKDRLTTLDSMERKRIIEKSRLAQERAQELRTAMARKKAQEAASKMSRE